MPRIRRALSERNLSEKDRESNHGFTRLHSLRTSAKSCNDDQENTGQNFSRDEHWTTVEHSHEFHSYQSRDYANCLAN
jgi:hypothetical protein